MYISSWRIHIIKSYNDNKINIHILCGIQTLQSRHRVWLDSDDEDDSDDIDEFCRNELNREGVTDEAGAGLEIDDEDDEDEDANTFDDVLVDVEDEKNDPELPPFWRQIIYLDLVSVLLIRSS